MNINLSPISFQARLTRETGYNGKPATKKQWLDSYDKSIEVIQKQKGRAIELDTFMRSDEVKKRLRQLPKETTVEMVSNLWVNDEDIDDGPIEVKDLMLDYNGADVLKYLSPPHFVNIMQKERLCIAQTKNGEINKAGILAWLDKMVYLSK